MKMPAKLTVVSPVAGVSHAEDRLRVRLVIELVALAMDVPADQIRSPSRNNARAARARQTAMYLAYIAWQWPLARVGDAFGRDRTTVGHACRVIEDLRDDRRFDQTLDRLEAALAGLPAALEFKSA
ncbi:helix-turn-helix domain-containing protein [Asticcacaulis sp. YBE204]|uniref:helix-turn-helix domain-containing protein n=1 Tax=Asticcacaulis sp. YBE204 TaxID=1282363 RepID=UPI0003C3DECE|nr:helix-turn-helix domain-containing protein [Asticcacaulis sp. YBE204]ESQ79656.1 hypothetical protein AEYBE204_07385 [Asticcacaulis sp. YBE204]